MKIGSVELPSPFVVAPMAGMTDTAFRRLVKRHGGGGPGGPGAGVAGGLGGGGGEAAASEPRWCRRKVWCEGLIGRSSMPNTPRRSDGSRFKSLVAIRQRWRK